MSHCPSSGGAAAWGSLGTAGSLDAGAIVNRHIKTISRLSDIYSILAAEVFDLSIPG
jgi:hypothetical protein